MGARWYGHWFLPHEKRMIRDGWDRQSTRSPRNARLYDRNYGPEGRVLFLATTANVLPAAAIGVVGICVTLLSAGRNPAYALGYALVLAGLALGIIGIPRVVQMERAGRAFRGEAAKVSLADLDLSGSSDPPMPWPPPGLKGPSAPELPGSGRGSDGPRGARS